eukprot:gene18909-6269_t
MGWATERDTERYRTGYRTIPNGCYRGLEKPRNSIDMMFY